MTAAVVGAGPAGLFVVGTLLDAGLSNIRWIDCELDGAGRLKLYSMVPGNTQTVLLVEALLECGSFKAAWEHLRAQGRGHSLTFLEGLQQDAECSLEYVVAAYQELMSGLLETFKGRISTVSGYVDRIDYSSSAAQPWTVSVGADTYKVHLVVLATGSAPLLPIAADARHAPHILNIIPLDDALSPAALADILKTSAGKGDIAVVGSSHSAVLVLRNISDILSSRGSGNTSRVKNFYRSPFRYARYLDAKTIINDNTGLKGIAAQWARDHLEDGCSSPLSYMLRIKTDAELDDKVYTNELSSCSSIVYAIGYQRNRLPMIVVDGVPVKSVGHGDDGQLVLDGMPHASLFGYGIAFPQRITGVAGNAEDNVGLWKFVTYIRASLGQRIRGIVS